MDFEKIDFNSLDLRLAQEYAEKDPAWNKALAVVNQVPTIRDFFFLGSLTDCLLFVSDTLQLYARGKDPIVRQKMYGVPQLIDAYVKVGAMSPDKLAAYQNFVVRGVEDLLRKKVAEYDLWIINQGLVMLCTKFDAFLENVVDVILTKKPELLYSIAEAKTLELKRIVRLGSVEAIIGEIKAKEIRRFSFEEIGKRFEYLQSKLHIALSDVFNWALYVAEVSKKFAGWDLKSLMRIYTQRHSVVHRNDLPVQDFDELSTIKEFLEKLILNVTLAAKKKHDLWSEPDRLLYLIDLWTKFESETEATR